MRIKYIYLLHSMFFFLWVKQILCKIDKQVILCSIIDITDRKNAEKQLKEKQAQLTHADRCFLSVIVLD